MQQQQTGYLLLLVLALMLMAIGSQGSLGIIIAVAFCPNYVSIIG